MEPRVGVEPTTCRLRIDCSTTELPRPCFMTIAPAENHCQFAVNGMCGNVFSGTCLMGKGKHRPPDADAHQQKKKQRPENVLHAVLGAAAAKKTEGDGNDHGEEQKRLEVGEFERRQSDHA